MGSLRIVYVGPHSGTCLQRAQGLEQLGHRIEYVPVHWFDTRIKRYVHALGRRLGWVPDLIRANARVRERFRENPADLLWVDKGLSIAPGTLRSVRELAPRARLVHYSPDDMFNPQNQSRNYLRSIPWYDLHVTTKSYNVAELEEAGARDVIFVDNAYDPEVHRPLELTEAERRELGADVGFVGAYEEERGEWIHRLAEEGIEVSVWGPHWDRAPRRHERLRVRGSYLDGIDYAKGLNATRINLGFLRKVNRDVQTTRSIEIPACRAFMLAERTDEHLRLFEEGREAEFFDSFEELLEKTRYYLEHEHERRAIAEAGYQRCIRGRYSNRDRLEQVIERIQASTPSG